MTVYLLPFISLRCWIMLVACHVQPIFGKPYFIVAYYSIYILLDYLPVVAVVLSCYNKVPQTGRHENQKCIFSQFWSQKSKVKVLAGLISSEGWERSVLGLSLWLEDYRLSPHVFKLSSIYACFTQIFSSYKYTSHIELGSTSMNFST